jgi:thermitase
MVRNEPLALVVDLPSDSVSFFEAQAMASGFARYFEPIIEFKAQFIPNDPYYPYQWALQKIQADWAWNTTTGNRSILVAVIDTGIDYNHPDLAANYNASGYNWVNNDADPMDDNGHGTHVAGIIAAVLNNSLGIAGVAQVQIMAEKALNATGFGTDVECAEAIINATDWGAKILSCSWGGDEGSQLLHDAIQYAYGQGALIVAAAGNTASTAKTYPAAYTEVIGVTATDQYDQLASFSSYGDWVELAAPGVQILSTYLNDSYVYLSGTSMACPYVSGVAALIWSQFPNATRDWVRAQLRVTADDLGLPGFDPYYGYGRINARKAVEQLPPSHQVLILTWERPDIIQPGEMVTFNLTALNFGTSEEKNVTSELFINGDLTYSATTADLASGSAWTAQLPWNPQGAGIFNVTVYVVPVANQTVTDYNGLSELIFVQQMLTLTPSQGAVGTQVNVTGTDFTPSTEVMVTFNDVFLGYTSTDSSGSFVFTFNVPLSSAGTQAVKAVDTYGISASSNFVVIDTTPLMIQVDVGTTHFIGETAEFYAETSFKGQVVNATQIQAVLYKPDGATVDLTGQIQPISTGLYKIPYDLTQNETGTYTLVVTAGYVNDTVQAADTTLKCFLVSDTLTLMNQQVVSIKDGLAEVQADIGLIRVNMTDIDARLTGIEDGVASVQTDLGVVEVNLTALNATLDSIFMGVTRIEGNTATIQTTIGTMNGTITAINGNMTTILVPGVGQVTVGVSQLKQPQYVVLSITSITAVAAIISVALLLRRRKRIEPEPNP